MISSIELLGGASLSQMTSPQTTYKVQRTDTEHISVTLAAPDLQAEGLHLQTWGSSHLLANRLHRIPVTFPSSSSSSSSGTYPILELGAGTGLVGISAAAIWGQSAMLTDFASIVPGTAANVAHNASLLAQHGGRAICGSLDWNSAKDLLPFSSQDDGDKPAVVPPPPPPSLASRAHIILTADTLYTAEQPALLARCIDTWLARSPDARAIVCYPLRVAALDAIRDFWARMDALGFEAVHEQQERVEGDEHEWDDERLHEWAVFRWREGVLGSAPTSTLAATTRTSDIQDK